MKVKLGKEEYSVNVPGPDPFIIMNGMIYGLTPPAPEKHYELLMKRYKKVFAEFRKEVISGKADTETFDIDQRRSWIKESSRTGEVYNVIYSNGNWTCSCKGFTFRKTCKHIEECQEEI